MAPKIIFAAAFGGMLILPATSFADSAGELAITMTHAGLAAGAADIEGVHMHLHHVLNCMVGPKGVEFDSHNTDPCASAGSGLLIDMVDAAAKVRLENALMMVKAGLATDNLVLAKEDANDAVTALKTIQ